MTLSEARAYLSLYQFEGIQECYEDYVFEQKRFFKEKQVHPKLYESKFIKIKKAIEAFTIIQYKESQDPTDFYCEPFNYTGLILSDFHAFHRVKNQFFTLLYQATSLSKIISIAKCILDNELKYAETWKLLNVALPEETPTKIVDPMMVLSDVIALEKKGVVSNKDYNPMLNLEFQNLNAEINRLTKISH